MSEALPAVSMVLKLFMLLFSNRWIRRWQRQWARQQAELARPEAAASFGKGKRGKKRSRRRPKSRNKQSSVRGFYERILTLRVTLWCLIFERLNFDPTLSAVVRNLRAGGADRLDARGRKVSKRLRSNSTSAYNQARQRLPLELLQGALQYLAEKIAALVGWSDGRGAKPPACQRRRQLLDGSTLAMLRTPELARAYRPARVRTGDGDWCLMRILVGFCARSGAILSVIEAPTKQSEQRLAWIILEKAAAFIIWIGDRNFGVWSVVAQAVRYHQDVLVRLTRSRAAKLAAGRPLCSGEDRPVLWSPSRHDQAAPGTKRTAIAGRLIYVRLKRGHKWIDLWLFTTLEAENYPLELLVQWYGQRWQAELHFRSVKSQMRLSQIDVCTPEMARKEFYAAMLAYNLVRGVMWASGERLEAGMQSISFNDARRVVSDWLEDWARRLGTGAGSADRWVRSLLEEVMQQKLPKRKKPRPTQVRMVRSRASKWPTLKGSRAAAQKRYGNNSKSL